MFLRKSIFGTASMLGLAGMLAFSGCSSDANHTGISSDDTKGVTGSIGLSLRLADGSDVETVNYTVKRNGVTVTTGTLAIGADGLATGTINNLDAGGGYTIDLDAPRTYDGGAIESCTGSASFSVVASVTTPVAVVLQCSEIAAVGNVTINGTFNICPRLGIATAAPASQAVGSSVALQVTASDKDMDTLTLEWFTGASYGTGSTVFATGATASFACTTPGSFLLNVSAYDGAARGCRKVLSTPISVTCTGSTTVDSGTPAVDSGAVDSGTPAVDSGTPAVDSGTSEVDSGTPAVDSGVVDSGTGPGLKFGTAACGTCLEQQCNPYLGYDTIFTDCVDAACDAAFACYQRNHCATNTADLTMCYCGTGVGFVACTAPGYNPNGPCAELTERGLGFDPAANPDPATVMGLFFGGDTGTSDGIRLFNCAAELCIDSCVTATDIPAP